MRRIKLPQTDLEVSEMGYGCSKLAKPLDNAAKGQSLESVAEKAMRCAVEQGINLFDHADIYQAGDPEQLFGRIVSKQPGLRENMVIQSKCVIRREDERTPQDTFTWYDASREHIMKSVEGILKRLKTDYLDILLLHQPDVLVEPDEVAAAFDALQASGKVRAFGVSNHNAQQIALLTKSARQPISVNQVQVSMVHTQLFDESILFNRQGLDTAVAVQGTLEYCRTHGTVLQAYAPVRKAIAAADSGRERWVQLAKNLSDIAQEKGVSREAVCTAWLLRYPWPIQPIIGSRTPSRIQDCAAGCRVKLSRKEWYRLFVAGRAEPLLQGQVTARRK